MQASEKVRVLKITPDKGVFIDFVDPDVFISLPEFTNIDCDGQYVPDTNSFFKVSVLLDDLMIFSSPHGEVRHLPLTRIFLHGSSFEPFYGNICVARMGRDSRHLVSVSDVEAAFYGQLFSSKVFTFDRLIYFHCEIEASTGQS